MKIKLLSLLLMSAFASSVFAQEDSKQECQQNAYGQLLDKDGKACPNSNIYPCATAVYSTTAENPQAFYAKCPIINFQTTFPINVENQVSGCAYWSLRLNDQIVQTFIYGAELCVSVSRTNYYNQYYQNYYQNYYNYLNKSPFPYLKGY